MKHFTTYIIAVMFLSLALWSCRKDRFDTDPNSKLEFSVDTVLFDTIFSTVGSTTAALKVYNNSNQKIRISNIDLAGGEESQYRLNVDGINGASFSEIELAANDSMWLFVEVTVDPGNLNLPFIVEDSIVFETNGNTQSVLLHAWGQDAYFHGRLHGAEYLPNCDEVWNNDKPHVLYGIVAVDSACSLTINPGVQVYCHARSGLYIRKGSIDINGELGNEVVFQGDRLESFFADLSGQWGIEVDVQFETGFGVQTATLTRGGIYLYEARPSQIDYAILKNGIIGIQVDTTGAGSDDVLVLTNTKISNMSAIGLYSLGGWMSGYNNEITNCGQSCVALTIGGSYDFRHCTFANYWTESNRQAPAFLLNNYYVDVDDNIQLRPFEKANFFNCIMHGNNAQLTDFSEWFLDLEEPDSEVFEFHACYVDSDEDLSNDGLHYFNISKTFADPPFLDPFNGDFDLPASINSQLNAGNSAEIGSDIKNQSRSGPVIAMGCHQQGD